MNAHKQIALLDVTDTDGRIRMSGIHDAQLIAISYVSMKNLEFSFKGTNDEYTIIKISNPSTVNVMSLWEGSIIDSIHAWNVNSVPEKTWNDPQDAWNALLDQRVSNGKRRADVERIILNHSKSILMVVSCIYGGQWAAVGEDAVISQTSNGKA